MNWINFLHCYQPANSEAHIIKEATEKSYFRIIKALEENKNIKFTLNISGCLFLRLEELGYQGFIKRVVDLVKQGNIELVSTVCYHPLMPLIPEKEIRNQIKENEEILQNHFGSDFKAKGFFMPEMAYSQESAKIIADFGYEWIILDEIANGGILKNDFNSDSVYYDKNSGLKVVLRNREISSSFVPATLHKFLKEGKKELKTIITATDGELYGLRHIDHTGEFEKILQDDKIKTKTVSEYIKEFDEYKKINLVACNWESTEKELKNNLPYFLWYNTKKKIHLKLWELANLCIATVNNFENDANFGWARWHLVRGLASCSFWWASGKDFRSIFGPQAWNPDEIEKGANDLVRSVRALENNQTKKQKIKAERLFAEIRKLIWKKHWLFYWK